MAQRFEPYVSPQDQESDSSEQQPWVKWYCSLKGNEFFCDVDESFIEDSFNLTGLDSQIRHYHWALDVILDRAPREEIRPEVVEQVEEDAEMLYGLIHQRFIITQRGLDAMFKKYQKGQLGRCPRVLCNGQQTLPIGLTPTCGLESVRLYCPRCEEIYASKVGRHVHIDGAYFGPTFPHLFLLAFPDLKPPELNARYVPRLFGFRIHESAYQQSDAYRLEGERIDKTTQQLVSQAKKNLLQPIDPKMPQKDRESIEKLIQHQGDIYKQMTRNYMNIHTANRARMIEAFEQRSRLPIQRVQRRTIDDSDDESEEEDEDEDEEEEQLPPQPIKKK